MPLTLRPFTESDYDTLIGWVDSEELLFQFAGNGFRFPLTRKQLHAFCNAHPPRSLFIADLPEQGPVAFGEIVWQPDGSARLARLLIGRPDLRGKGIGQAFVRLLVQECHARKAKPVELFVLLDNARAIACYQKVGFEAVPDWERALLFRNVAMGIGKMRLSDAAGL